MANMNIAKMTIGRPAHRSASCRWCARNGFFAPQGRHIGPINVKELCKTVQKSCPWGANLWTKFHILTVFGAVFCRDKHEIWHGAADF